MRSVWPNNAFAKAQAKLASLTLKRIDMKTPAAVLERLIQYEAVHKIRGWRDLQRRLENDRRCYALFDTGSPDEPIIFVEAALVRGMSLHVQPLIDPDAPIRPVDSADSAICYSISKCQDGLGGVPLGGFLINKVLEELSNEFRQLSRFATLSPVPGFRAWLRQAASSSGCVKDVERFRELLRQTEQSNWIGNDGIRQGLGRSLVPLCAHYLLYVKNGAEPLDPVGRFHLRNGARLERINWIGDTSPTGIDRSATIMANYLYRPTSLQRNHELYVREFKVIASREVRDLAESCFPSQRNGGASGT
jgi:malonyl-CoA decarboxylase